MAKVIIRKKAPTKAKVRIKKNTPVDPTGVITPGEVITVDEYLSKIRDNQKAVRGIVSEINSVTPALKTIQRTTNTEQISQYSIDRYGDGIRELHSRGLSITKTARALDTDVSTVVKVGRALGLHFDGRVPQALAFATRAQNDVRKANLKADMLTVTEKLVHRLMKDDEFVYVASGTRGIMVETVPAIPGDQARDLSTAARNLMYVVERIEANERERERNDSSTIDQWLGTLTGTNKWTSNLGE